MAAQGAVTSWLISARRPLSQQLSVRSISKLFEHFQIKAFTGAGDTSVPK
jgi:hypothetical protein